MKVRRPSKAKEGIATNANQAVQLGKSRHESQCKANIINLNLKVIKDHVLKQDTFAFGYIVTTVDLVMELLVHSRRGMHQPIPMELIQIFDVADNILKLQRGKHKKKPCLKDYTRTYVQTWCKLVRYIAAKFDYFMVEYIMVESYNRISVQPYLLAK